MKIDIDNSHYRLIFYRGKKLYSWKEHTKMSNLAKFENFVHLNTFVLCAEIATTFLPHLGRKW